MCGDEIDAGETELQSETAFEFESYFDRGSGLWSLRRVPTTIPPKPDEGASERRAEHRD